MEMVHATCTDSRVMYRGTGFDGKDNWGKLVEKEDKGAAESWALVFESKRRARSCWFSSYFSPRHSRRALDGFIRSCIFSWEPLSLIYLLFPQVLPEIQRERFRRGRRDSRDVAGNTL